MNGTFRYRVPPHGREQIAEIVGCHMVDGVCVQHQTREPRRPGCPLVDSLMRYAGHPAPPASAAG